MNDMNVLLMDGSAQYMCSLTFTLCIFYSKCIRLARDSAVQDFGKKEKKIVADYSVRKASLRQKIISRGDDGKDDNLGGGLMALEIK